MHWGKLKGRIGNKVVKSAATRRKTLSTTRYFATGCSTLNPFVPNTAMLIRFVNNTKHYLCDT